MSTAACTWPESTLPDPGFMFLISVRLEERIPRKYHFSHEEKLISREMVVSDLLWVL